MPESHDGEDGVTNQDLLAEIVRLRRLCADEDTRIPTRLLAKLWHALENHHGPAVVDAYHHEAIVQAMSLLSDAWTNSGHDATEMNPITEGR